MRRRPFVSTAFCRGIWLEPDVRRVIQPDLKVANPYGAGLLSHSPAVRQQIALGRSFDPVGKVLHLLEAFLGDSGHVDYGQLESLRRALCQQHASRIWGHLSRRSAHGC